MTLYVVQGVTNEHPKPRGSTTYYHAFIIRGWRLVFIGREEMELTLADALLAIVPLSLIMALQNIMLVERMLFVVPTIQPNPT